MLKMLAFAAAMGGVALAANATIEAVSAYNSLAVDVAAMASTTAMESPDFDARLCALRGRALTLAGGAAGDAASPELSAAVAQENARTMRPCAAAGR